MHHPSDLAWLLNLDAEMEFAAPLGYTPSRALLQLIERRTPDLKALLGDSLIVAAQGGKRGVAKGLTGIAWSPTPHARRQLARSGASVPPAPDFEVLRKANSREFCAQLGQTLTDAQFVGSAADAICFLESKGSALSEQRWLIKRMYGFAGRGQRRMRAPLSGDDIRWLRDGEKYGGLQLEPLLRLRLELSLHGYIGENDSLQLGQLCVQQTDEHHAWLSTRLARTAEVSEGTSAAILLSAEQVARALQSIGYFGPFGVDAFIYADQHGQDVLNPRSEINARYSMGFAVGMQSAR